MTTNIYGMNFNIYVVDEIIGADFGLKRVLDMTHYAAPLDSPVLLLGETGTGKEVIAGAIHSASPRRGCPFIRVDCGAIPETLVDSELFGYEKGTFAGALSKRRGSFERAHGGTIFLDEIGELPLLCRRKPLTFADLDSFPHSPLERRTEQADERLTLNQVMERHIRRILRITRGKIEGKGGAGELLGPNPGTLRHRIRRLGISFNRMIKYY